MSFVISSLYDDNANVLQNLRSVCNLLLPEVKHYFYKRCLFLTDLLVGVWDYLIAPI